MSVSGEIVKAYLKCRHKAALLLVGKSGLPDAYARILREAKAEYRPIAAQALARRIKASSVVEATALTDSELKHGSKVILGGTLEAGALAFEPDALARLPGRSSLGSFHYAPAMFDAGRSIRSEHRLLLAYGALVLGRVQGRRPEVAFAVCGDPPKTAKLGIGALAERADEAVRELRATEAGSASPRLLLNNYCRACEFRLECRRTAIERDDLSLLPGIREAEVREFEAKGISTVKQLSYTFRVRRRPKHLRDRPYPYSHALRALSLRESRVHVMTKPKIPRANARLFLDMEGDSGGRNVYLVGALVERDAAAKLHSFWADPDGGERGIAAALFDLLAKFDDAHVFHYGSYESRVLRRWRAEFSQRFPEGLLRERLTNVLSAIYARVYFPTLSNGLKEIGRYLGCRWERNDASGLASVRWRHQWEETRNDTLKQRLVRYNADDCVALKRVTDFLASLDERPSSVAPDGPAYVDELVKADDLQRWGTRNLVLDDFRQIADCAHFDYQHSKVYIRTSSAVRKAQRRRARRRGKRPRPNKIVRVHARKCWHCGSSDIARDADRYHVKPSYDLRMSAQGIKRWVVQYRTRFHRCNQCRTPFVPRSYKRRKRFEHNLVAWVIHNHVAHRLPLSDIHVMLRETFGLHLKYSEVHGLKAAAAGFYQATYERLLRDLVDGPLIHADETTVKLQGEDGYVWVFTNMHDVVHMYRPDRSGRFLGDAFDGFDGVLVTDFFSAYDSLHCAQQKCLIHLIWDINSDLHRHPFDEDFRSLASSFGRLLRKIVGTVDRYGLKSRFLRKHKADVRRFYRKLAGGISGSEVAGKYRRRLERNRDHLFTFLDRDGVPWNNNNAERAVKHFARFRRGVTKRTMKPHTLRDYLVLLSLYVTCEYRGVSFLDFLLSKERCIDAYCSRVR